VVVEVRPTTTAADLVRTYAANLVRAHAGAHAGAHVAAHAAAHAAAHGSTDAQPMHVVFADCYLPPTTVLMGAGVMDDAEVHVVATRRSPSPHPTRSPCAPDPAPDTSPPRIRLHGRPFPGF